jgi:hypothetical protein
LERGGSGLVEPDVDDCGQCVAPEIDTLLPSFSRMRPVSELYGRYPGSDIYVIGTGPSLRVFPTGFLDDRITIGLNFAWEMVRLRYAMTIHPDLHVPEFLPGREPQPEVTWIIKREKMHGMAEEHTRYAEENFYSFRTDGRENTMTDGQSDSGRFTEWVERPTGDFLYLWRSISQPAVNLAANMGAKNIILVGCDGAALGGSHHSHTQHTRWLGAEPDKRYHDYYEAMAEVRTALRVRGVNLVSMTPFLTLATHEEDFLRLCEELEAPTKVETYDITPSYRPPWMQAEANRVRAQGRRRLPSSVRRFARALRRRTARH